MAKVIGVVLTERLHINNMSVDELVGMGRSPYTGFWGHMSAYDKQVVDESIALVGIEGLRGRMMQRLSDGERQKVMIAKALAQETPVIFLDEPTAFLDYPSKVEIMQLLQRLSREKEKTVFLSTHDLELALQIADKVWLLDKPNGVTIGSPEDLALRGEMTKYFHREGVTFDIESGLFKIDHKLTNSVTLEGNGPVANMIRKALALAIDIVAMKFLLTIDVVSSDLTIENGVLVIAKIDEAISALSLEITVHIVVLEDIFLVESFTILLKQTIVSCLSTVLNILLVGSIVDRISNNCCTLAHMLTCRSTENCEKHH